MSPTVRFSLSKDALSYSLRQLAQRVGSSEYGSTPFGFKIQDIPVYYERASDTRIEQPAIIVSPCSKSAWPLLLEREPNSLTWLPIREVLPKDARQFSDGSIPVLFWGEGYEDGTKPFVEQREDGSIIFYADIVAATFFMLSRWEETVTPERDQHGRFPATASVAFKQGFLHQPVVDEYALILSAWIRVLLPQWSPHKSSFSIKLSHDIDMVRHYRNLYRTVLTIGADIVKRRDPLDAWHNVKSVLPLFDPVFTGIYRLSALSCQYGMNSSFYFMAATPNHYDIGYDVCSHLVQRCIRDLQLRGHEIGFHASYRSFNDLRRLATEKAKLDTALGATSYGGRQHYLRFQVPYTWRHWEELGFTYDSTVGYADHEGFRCGTSHAYRPFDIGENREIDLWEQPLIVMDGTLLRYRGLTPEEGRSQMLELAGRCKQVGGTFTLLWHNSSLNGEWAPWAEVYEDVLKVLSGVN